MSKKTKKLADVGQRAPSNFKFGLVVTVAIFWAELLRSVCLYLLSFISKDFSPIVTNLLIAIFFTLFSFLILYYYPQIREWTKKISLG